MSAQPVIILGVNGNCIDIAEAIEAVDDLEVAGFLDDDPKLDVGTLIAGYPVLGRITDAAQFTDSKFVCGIGSPRSYRAKPEIIRRTGIPREQWATVIHPSCSVSRLAQIGPGTVLLAHVAVGARAQVGAFCTILQGSVVSHDSIIGEHSILATGVCVSGGCIVGTGAYLGCRSCLREGTRIGDRALVGMGAVVVDDIPADAVAFGNPARLRP